MKEGETAPQMAEAGASGETPVALRAALWMVGALLSFALMAVSVRELLHAMGALEMVLLRSVVALAILLAILPRYGARALSTERFGLHVLRNVMHFGGQCAWIYAIGALPLATVFAIEFTMPAWATVLAVLILRERMNRNRVVMLAAGFVGISIILKPGFEQVHPAALVMLAGSFAYASTMIATKRLAGHDTAIAVLFYMAVIQGVIALVAAAPAWRTPGIADLPWILALGTTSLSAHFCLTRAFSIADAALVVPFDCMRLPLIAVVGMLFYNEPLQLAVFAGAAVMFAGIYYSIRRETRMLRTPPVQLADAQVKSR